MKDKQLNKCHNIKLSKTKDSVNENELLWMVSSIILDELLKTKLKKKDVETKEPLKN